MPEPQQSASCPTGHWPSDFKGRDLSGARNGAVGRVPGTMPKRPQRGLEQVPEEEEAGKGGFLYP